MNNTKFDLIVIGGGPGGYSAAISAAKCKKKVAVFESDKLGGTCLNVGCIPTKYLLDKAAALDKMRELTENSILRDAGAFSFRGVMSGKDAIVKKLTGGIGTLLNANGITMIYGTAELKQGRCVVCNGIEYSAKDIIIATGSEPVSLNVPGAEYAIDSTAVLSLKKVPSRLCVIGGGVIGLELASAFASFGSEVSIIELMPALLPSEMPEAAALLTKKLTIRGIDIHCGAKVEKIEKTDNGYIVNAKAETGLLSVEADVVLMAVGRRARLSGIDVKSLGLTTGRGNSIEVDDHMHTSVENIWAIGDVIGGYQLAHAAFAEAEVAVANICGGDEKIDYRVLPRCIYTSPCFAAVGMTPEQAKVAKIEVVVGTFDYSNNGMALAEGALGTVYTVMDKSTQKTIGFVIVGANASELIAFASTAVRDGYTPNDWKKLIVAHPSLSEMLKDAALSAFEKSIHK